MKTMNQNSNGRKAGVILVGQLDGVRHIRWGTAFFLSCTLGVFGGAVATAAYFVLASAFSPLAAMIGFCGPFITVGSDIQRAIKLPVEQLPTFEAFA